ncbi:5779_t:CDS:1, partial [Paraglomus brasilianum]
KAHEKYFTDFQSYGFCFANVTNSQIKGAHQAFYKFLNAVLKENTSTEDAINMPDVFWLQRRSVLGSCQAKWGSFCNSR